MRSLTFSLDVQTGDDQLAPVTITITEMADGSLSFSVSNENDDDNMIADLRALFFDVADDDLLGTLSVAGDDFTEMQQDGDVSNLGGGATSSGVPNSPYEVGIEFGTSGMATDDIQTTTFILSSSLRDLTLDDIALESFTVRQTSVGEIDGAREDSDKLYGDAPYPVNAQDDYAELHEDTVFWSNLVANDIDLDALDQNADGIIDQTITAINGDSANVEQTLIIADGVTLYVQNDGTYSVDALDADYLSAGETLDLSFTYSVDDGNGGSDEATAYISVHGVNDAPIAEDDFASSDEATAVSGNVLLNDSDIDRLDSFAVTAIEGSSEAVNSQITLASGALLTLNSDGTFQYDPNGAFDGLDAGETATDSFTYQITDNHGASDSATVEIEIAGLGGGSDVGTGNHFGTFANKRGTADQEISNVVLYMENEEGIQKVKIDGWSGGETDLDDVNLASFMETYYSDFDLLGVSIKAGNNHNKDLGPGEGQFFLIDGDDAIDYQQGGDAPEGFSYETLSAKADEMVMYSSDLFV